MCIHIYIYIYINISLSLSIYIYIYIYIYRYSPPLRRGVAGREPVLRRAGVPHHFGPSSDSASVCPSVHRCCSHDHKRCRVVCGVVCGVWCMMYGVWCVVCGGVFVSSVIPQ